MCFLNIIPGIRDLIGCFINVIFDIIDGGIILIENIVPQGVYIDESVVIFILCLYVLYFLSRYTHSSRIRNISLVFYCILFLYINSVNFKIEFDKYFDKNYVIIRNRFKSYMYIDSRMSNVSVLEDKLGIDKVFQGSNGQDFLFFKHNVHIKFDNEKVFLNIDNISINTDIRKDKERYYSTVYPTKFYVIF